MNKKGRSRWEQDSWSCWRFGCSAMCFFLFKTQWGKSWERLHVQRPGPREDDAET